MIFSIIIIFLVHMMTGSVATCAGSSGRAQPPPNPHRLPSHCELASDQVPRVPRPRKGRGKAKGHDITSKVAAEGRLKLTFDESGGTWKAFGPFASWYDSAVGIHTRDCCEPFHTAWKDVPTQQKTQIRERLLEWFDIDYETMDGIFRDVVDRDAKKCYKDWKNDLSTHFRTFDSVDDARAAPPPSIRNDRDWGLCCDRFASPEFQKKSETNKANRKKHKYPSYHGRRSYIQHRAKKVNTETQAPLPAIENWRDMHQRGGTWANDEAEQTYCMLDEQRQTQLGQSASGSVAAPPSAPEVEYPILEQVFGSRRGYRTGVGPTLPHHSHSHSYCSHASTGTSIAPHTQCQEEIQSLRAEVRELTEVIRRFLPDALLHRPAVAPPSSSSAAPNQDDDAANLRD